MGNPAAKILIVDDTRLNIEIVKALLQSDYGIYTATNGLEALQICQNEQIDLILLDVEMPELDGYETCARLLKKSFRHAASASESYHSGKFWIIPPL